MYQKFERDILAMNHTYKLPQIDVSSWHNMASRLIQFQDILEKECAEIVDIEGAHAKATDDNAADVRFETVVNLADLLGDIVVYCASEAARWGIPLPQVLQIIMASNTSKLGEDGQPIINPSNGKFEKGPNYWKPEPAIAHLLKYQGDGIQFTRSPTGVITVELFEPGAVAGKVGDTGIIIYMDAVTAAASQQKPNEEK